MVICEQVRISNSPCSDSYFTAFLGCQMSELRCSSNRKPGTSRNRRAAEPLLPRNRAGSYSVSGGSAVLKEYVAAASTVPGRLAASSASRASFQEDARQSAASAPPSPTSTTSIPASHSVHQPHPLHERNHTVSSSNLSDWSTQSHVSEKISTIVNSRESLPISVDQPSRPPRGTYRQNITHSDSRLAIATTYVHSHLHDPDEGRSPVVPPSSSFFMHGPQRRCGSSTSINLSIQGPSTDSLPITSMEESMAIDHAHSAPSYSATGQSETVSQHSTIASSATSEFILPEGRFVQMIHSDQILRYDKNVTM